MDELEHYYHIFSDAWKVFRKYADCQFSEEYWQNMIRDVSEYGKHYNYEQLVLELAQVILRHYYKLGK